MNRIVHITGWTCVLALSSTLLALPTSTRVGGLFSPQTAKSLPLCRQATCAFDYVYQTADKSTGQNKRERYVYNLSWPQKSIDHAQLTVIVDARTIVQSAKLTFSVPKSTPTADYRALVLLWGKSFGLTPAQFAPCLTIGSAEALHGYPSYAGLPPALDGTCNARVQASGKADFSFDITFAEQ